MAIVRWHSIGNSNVCCVGICCFLTHFTSGTFNFEMQQPFVGKCDFQEQQLQIVIISEKLRLVELQLLQEQKYLKHRCLFVQFLAKLYHGFSLSACLNSWHSQDQELCLLLEDLISIQDELLKRFLVEHLFWCLLMSD